MKKTNCFDCSLEPSIFKKMLVKIGCMNINICIKQINNLNIADMSLRFPGERWYNPVKRDSWWILNLVIKGCLHWCSMITWIYHSLHPLYCRTKVQNITCILWTPRLSFSISKKYYCWNLNITQIIYISHSNNKTWRITHWSRICSRYQPC